MAIIAKCIKRQSKAIHRRRLYKEYNAASFRNLVRNERARELCFEATRKYDLIRWGIFVKEMNDYYRWTIDARWASSSQAMYARTVGNSVQQKHILLPIPAVELGVNSMLKQNALW